MATARRPASRDGGGDLSSRASWRCRHRPLPRAESDSPAVCGRREQMASSMPMVRECETKDLEQLGTPRLSRLLDGNPRSASIEP